MLTLFWNVNVKVVHEPAAIVRWAVVPSSELVVSEPPPVDVLKILVPPILIWVRLPLVACGQVMDSPVSTWLTVVLFRNVITTVLPENVLLVTTTVCGVAVGVGVDVGVDVAVGVAVAVAVAVGEGVGDAVGVGGGVPGSVK